MKRIHYRNIGYPRTGTTWIYLHLLKHPEVDGKLGAADWRRLLMHKEQTSEDPTRYLETYERYDVSVNFDTNVYKMEYPPFFASPETIHNHTTHLSVSLRNPYQLLNSWFNYVDHDYTASEFLSTDCKDFIELTNFKTTLENWSRVNIPFKILFYDDIEKNRIEFSNELCDFLGLSRATYDTSMVINKVKIKENLTFDESISKHINDQISFVEDFTKRDLSHWKHGF